MPGIRDEGLLTSASARPENVLAYGGSDVTLWQIAASLGFGPAKNHPCFDGNKRTSLVATYLVVRQNGYDIVSNDDQLFQTWQSLAAGEIGEDALSVWIETNAKPIPR